MKFPPNTNPTPITDAADRVIPGETAYEHSVRRSVAMADIERQLAEAREQRDRLADAIERLERERRALRSYEHRDAPGHWHDIASKWDADGSPCSWCGAWDHARAVLAAVKASNPDTTD